MRWKESLEQHSYLKEASSLAQDPSPFCQLDLPLLQGLVAVVELVDALLQTLAALGKLINLGSGRGSERLDIQIELAESNARLLHLVMEVAQLAFDIIEASDFLREGSLESARLFVEL